MGVTERHTTHIASLKPVTNYQVINYFFLIVGSVSLMKEISMLVTIAQRSQSNQQFEVSLMMKKRANLINLIFLHEK